MLKLAEEKELTRGSSIRPLKPPAKVIIPLVQHLGKPAHPIVKPGDLVKTGQLIGSLEDKAIYAPVHSSVSGKVIAIDELPHPGLGRGRAVVIGSDGLDQKIDFKANSEGVIEQFPPHDIRKLIFDAGVVGMGGAGFPTHIKLSPPKPVDSFILNGAECEPYLTCDNRLMIEKAGEIILGIGLALKCLGVKQAYIAIEDNKPQAIRAFEKVARPTQCQIRILKSAYPQGGERQIIKAVLGREVPPGKYPFDVGVVVNNAATIYAMYEAVYLGKPLYERVITVSGDCLENPGNYLVRIGASIQDIINECGPLKKEPERIVFGGPMMGLAQYSLDTPVIKTTSGALFLSDKEAQAAQDAFCIRCGRCVEACPLGFMPCMIALAVEKGKWDLAKTYGALECMECGSCSYVCPQRRNIVQQIKYAKSRMPK